MVKLTLSAVYPAVSYIIDLILTEGPRPMLMLAVKKKILLNVSSPEADVWDHNTNAVTLSQVFQEAL